MIALACSYAFAGEMPWAKDFAASQKTAISEGKLTMLFFYADWCTWCKKLNDVTFVDEGIVMLAGRVVPLKVNTDDDATGLVKKFNVSALPTILFVDAKGDVWGKTVGYQEPEEFADEMSRVIDIHRTYPLAMKTLKKKPNDGRANGQIARVHANFGRVIEARSAVEKMEAAKYNGKDVATTYNSIGNAYKEAGQFVEAIKYFIKADGAGRAAKKTKDISYALISVVECYASIGDSENVKKYALQLIALKGGTKWHIDKAKQFLKGG